ncbi:MAG: hypothetical protein IPN71_09690 [Fibrobacteres bacterium]|nr:hypothetical protein [Fibrobacterota bacterium]
MGGLASHDRRGVRVHRFRHAWAPLNFSPTTKAPPPRPKSKPWLQLLAIPHILLGFVACWKLCAPGKFDLIHCHWPFLHGLIAQAESRWRKAPAGPGTHGAELCRCAANGGSDPFCIGFGASPSGALQQLVHSRQDPRCARSGRELPYGTTLPESTAAPSLGHKQAILSRSSLWAGNIERAKESSI